nr:unnamed protein product [Callosobruchus analis]
MVQEKTHRYIIFHIKDEREIDVQFVGARNEDYDEFLTDLQISGAKECRYGLYDLEYARESADTSSETDNIHKLFLILWSPNTAENKTKDIYKR